MSDFYAKEAARLIAELGWAEAVRQAGEFVRAHSDDRDNPAYRQGRALQQALRLRRPVTASLEDAIIRMVKDRPTDSSDSPQ